MNQKSIKVQFQEKKIYHDNNGCNFWKNEIYTEIIPGDKIAICICDMWDQHWSKGANLGVNRLADKINELAIALRKKNVKIIHAPSEVIDYYKEHPARKRIIIQKKFKLPKVKKKNYPPLPIDDSDGGSCTPNLDKFRVNKKVWKKQHSKIAIDKERDIISDNGGEISQYLKDNQIDYYFICGVHTNMCILNRSFGLKQMKECGFKVALIRDLTDSMYNPEMSPYVNHDEGTNLIIEYIEKFVSPTISSRIFLKN